MLQNPVKLTSDCSNTQFIQNVAIGGALIRVDRGVIGAQILNGNQWYRHPALNHAPQAFCNDPSLARFSPFTVNQTRSTNNLTDPKPYHPNDIDPLTLPPTYIDPWWSYQAEDNYECTKKFSDSETNEIIISTEIDSIEADSLFSYRMRYSLYEYLSHYPQLLDSSELYEPWMDSISENSNIDEFVMIESNINKLFQTPWEVLADTISAHLSTFTTHIVYNSTLAQLEYDSIIYIIDSILTIQDSLNLNYKSSLISFAEELHESLDEIEPNNALEVVIKSYLDIYISSFIADSITDDQLDRLQFISELCIDSYGKYPMAASLLIPPCQRTTSLDVITGCGSTEAIIIDKHDDSKVFEIFDIFGRSIYKSQETIGDELIRYLQIPSGIYFIKNLNNVRKIYKN
ncbi:MAG: hypothetical protein WBO44_13750 [Saprospiraceae bacterium]